MQLGHGLVEGPRGEPPRGHIQDDVDVLGTFARAGEARILGQVGLAEHHAQSLEQMLRGRGEHDEASVLRLERAARPARMLQTAALAHHALAAVERRGVFHDAERRLVERGVDPLALTGRVAVAQRGHHAECGEQSRQVIRIDGCRARGWAVGVAAEVPGAAEGRADRRVAGSLAQRTRLPERGDARHDQAWIQRVQRVPAQAPFLQHARAEVLEHDVDLRHQTTHDLLALRRAQVERHEFLVAIVDREPVRDAVLARSEPA